ncbi:MAG TPA: hypothetical protein DHV36_22195 [Desulfobacteraceae bacterium]|nr:hypothetical protein [Desulfobacteraceae bacterium]|tara:strand:+ start:444 stop:980 length:537 start_codon:yes stop_codon:yes gene_type:complete
METPESLYDYFFAALTYETGKLKHGEQKRVALDANISRSLFSQIKDPNHPKKASSKTQRKIASAFGYDNFRNFLIRGQAILSGSAYTPIEQLKENQQETLLKKNSKLHNQISTIIDKFQDPNSAIKLLHHLANIEQADPQTYRDIYKEAETAAKMIERHNIGASSSIGHSDETKSGTA